VGAALVVVHQVGFLSFIEKNARYHSPQASISYFTGVLISP
jgi:hypothetical protein